MNKYLTKIAKEYFNEEKVEDDRLSKKFGQAVVTGATAGIAMKGGMKLFQEPILSSLQNGKSTINPDVLEKIKDHALHATNSTMDMNEAFPRGAPNFGKDPGPFYADKHLIPGAAKNYVHFPEYKTQNGDALIHELGHAVDFNHNVGSLGHKLKLGSGVFSRLASGVPAAAIGGALLSNEKTRDYAWTVPVIASLPTMHSEYMANHHGNNLLKAHGVSAKGRVGFLGLAAKNLLGYAGAPAITAGTIAGINHFMRKGEEINADEWRKEPGDFPDRNKK
jgi:hypothetical protein